MKAISHAGNATVREAGESNYLIDTTFVLFFLAVELGQSFQAFAPDSILLAITLLVVAVAPYYLLPEEKPSFSQWVTGRFMIAGFAILLGALFRQTLGYALPQTFRFLPMTLLIVAAMLSCYIQFYGFLKLRFVK